MKYVNRLIGMLALLLVISGCGKESSEETQQQTGESSAVVAEGAELISVTGDYNFDTAGSPLYMDGSYYFTNNIFEQPEQSRTLRKSPSGQIDTLRMDNGVTTTLQASGDGTIYACEMLGHRVVELNKEGEVIRVVVDEYNGTRIDGPNDIVVDDKGGFYFSDSQFIAGGEVIRVIDDIVFPNGMGLSPDGSTLYVANTRGSRLLAYDVNSDGTVTNKRNFAELQIPEGAQDSGADGMAVDSQGNVYVATTQGIGVQVFDSEGNHIQNISAPTATNNVSFGGEQNNVILIAAQDGIYQIQGKYAGS